MRKYIMLAFISLMFVILTGCGGSNKPYEYANDSMALQSFEILGNVKRKKPEVSNEGLDRYPEYNKVFDGDEQEKKDIEAENKLLNASPQTYDSMNENGELFLNGSPIGRRLYKHTGSIGLYGGDISDKEKAIIKRIDITPRKLGNYITGLYAPAGEVIKIEISEDDLASTGGFSVWIGNAGNRSSGAAEIPADKSYTRMPLTVNEMKVNSTTTYVGSYLGGPIYLGEPANKNLKYSVTISGGVEYSHFILGLTNENDFERTKDSTAPYFDLEVWDDGIRHSGPKYLLKKFDYENFYNISRLWEKISLISNQAPSASADVGISMRYDTYVPAGAAVAFVGANFCVMPLDWFDGSLDYNNLTNNGMWGTIHEFNHHYQVYGSIEGGEVTNNAMSLLSYAMYTKISSGRHINKSLDGWNSYTSIDNPLKMLVNNEGIEPIYSLESYAVLIHTFGVETFLKVISTQEVKRDKDSWVKAWTDVTKLDMTYYFQELCKYTLENETIDYIKSLNYEPFIPIGSIFQTKSSLNSGISTVRPYQLGYQEKIEVDLNRYLILPKSVSYEIINIEGNTNGELNINNNGFTYLPNKDDFESNKVSVTISPILNGQKLSNITLEMEFIQKPNKLSVTTYKYDKQIYKNIAVAEANSFEGYTEVNSDYNDTYQLNGLEKNTITVLEGKIYFKDAGEYRLYIKGKDNVFMYSSIGNDKKYKLGAYLNGNSNYSNENKNAYYDIKVKKESYVYVKLLVLSNSDDGYVDLGYGKIVNENVSATQIPNQYILGLDQKYSIDTFITPNYFPKKYITNSSVISTNQFEIIASENFTPWDPSFELKNMLDGNINTYAHNNSIISEPISFVVDMNESKSFNYLDIFGKNADESHTPTTFDLYFGNSLEELILYKEYKDMKVENRNVHINFDEMIVARYFKIVVRDTESHRYLAISKINMGVFVDSSRLNNVFDDNVLVGGNWDTITTPESNFAEGVYTTNGALEFKFTGKMFGIYGISAKDTGIKVSIDGEKFKQIEVGQTSDLKIIYLVSDLSEEQHSIRIKVNDKNIILFSYFYN